MSQKLCVFCYESERIQNPIDGNKLWDFCCEECLQKARDFPVCIHCGLIKCSVGEYFCSATCKRLACIENRFPTRELALRSISSDVVLLKQIGIEPSTIAQTDFNTMIFPIVETNGFKYFILGKKRNGDTYEPITGTIKQGTIPKFAVPELVSKESFGLKVDWNRSIASYLPGNPKVNVYLMPITNIPDNFHVRPSANLQSTYQRFVLIRIDQSLLLGEKRVPSLSGSELYSLSSAFQKVSEFVFKNFVLKHCEDERLALTEITIPDDLFKSPIAEQIQTGGSDLHEELQQSEMTYRDILSQLQDGGDGSPELFAHLQKLSEGIKYAKELSGQ
jgi:hypothetical protein